MHAFAKPRKLLRPLIIGTLAGLAISGERKGRCFWGFGSRTKSTEATSTYIWGNGLYQISTGAQQNYLNFEPKLIKTFNGEDRPNLKTVVFGNGFEAGIDVDGNVLVWKMTPLHSTKRNGIDYNSRSDVVALDNSGDSVNIAFTKKFLWVLKKNGTVHQYAIEGKFNEETRSINNFEVKNKDRQIQSLNDIVQISTGVDHFVALDKNGNVFTMGDDTLGQCGLGVFERSPGGPFYERRVRNPEKVENLSKIKKIICGHNHTIAIGEDGQAYGWGNNSHMQLSHELEYARAEEPLLAAFLPVRIEKALTDNIVEDAAAGENFTFFVTRNKATDETEVFSCGFGMFGELACGRTKHVSDIEMVAGLSQYKVPDQNGKEQDVRISKLSCGAHHCMALLNVGSILEWGNNDNGQLGNRRRAFAVDPLLVNKFKFDNIRDISCGYHSSSVIIEKREEKKTEDAPKL